MSTIDSSNSLNTILDKLGIQKPAKETGSSDKLGQADFLKLMTTQLQNQDPFAPMENAEFIAQMAQFSTVTGITEISESLKGMSDQLSEFRIATAANMLGHSVLVPGSTAYPGSDGSISGAMISGGFCQYNIVYRSRMVKFCTHKNLVRNLRLIGFGWQDIPQEVSQNASIS